MIIPYKSFKLSQYSKVGLDKKIIVLSRSSTKNSLLDIHTDLVSYRMLLTTCAEKEYVLGFDLEEEQLNRFKKDYALYEAKMDDVMAYCKQNNNSLIIMNREQNRWVKVDPCDNVMSLFYIQLKSDS